MRKQKRLKNDDYASVYINLMWAFLSFNISWIFISEYLGYFVIGYSFGNSLQPPKSTSYQCSKNLLVHLYTQLLELYNSDEGQVLLARIYIYITQNEVYFCFSFFDLQRVIFSDSGWLVLPQIFSKLDQRNLLLQSTAKTRKFLQRKISSFTAIFLYIVLLSHYGS